MPKPVRLPPLQRALALLARLQRIHSRWEMRSAAMFLVIAIKREVTKPDLERLLKMRNGTCHRNMVLMEDLCLIRTEMVLGVTLIRLTEYGKEVVRELEEAVGPLGGG